MTDKSFEERKPSAEEALSTLKEVLYKTGYKFFFENVAISFDGEEFSIKPNKQLFLDIIEKAKPEERPTDAPASHHGYYNQAISDFEDNLKKEIGE